MKVRDGHIIVFEEVDIRWIADCMAAYLVRSQQLKNAGLRNLLALAVFVFAEFMVQNRPKTVGYQLASPGAV